MAESEDTATLARREATSARTLVDRLDQAVLAKALRGELVPQEPNDKPASVLLDRVKADQGGEAKSTTRRRPRLKAGNVA